MKVLFVIVTAVISLSAHAFLPEQPGDSKITQVEGADLYCFVKDGDGFFAIDADARRVWQAKAPRPGQPLAGLELKIEKFNTLRCGPGCYDILGTMQFIGQKATYSIVTKWNGTTKSVVGEATISGEPGEEPVKFELSCKKN